MTGSVKKSTEISANKTLHNISILLSFSQKCVRNFANHLGPYSPKCISNTAWSFNTGSRRDHAAMLSLLSYYLSMNKFVRRPAAAEAAAAALSGEPNDSISSDETERASPVGGFIFRPQLVSQME
jgi:hypothetical protein